MWHVDDFLVSHVDLAVNKAFVLWLYHKYSRRTPVAENRGLRHDCLWTQLDFSTKGKVKFSMRANVEEMISEVSAKFVVTAPTPAGKRLFNTSTDAERLKGDKAATFRLIVAKALFLSKRARPNIQLAVAFSCTHVKESSTYDWKNMSHMIQYLCGTRDLSLTLEVDNSDVVMWWVDAAFAVTTTLQSQSAGIMTLGKGAVYSASLRQQLNTRSSMELELVAANDFMP